MRGTPHNFIKSIAVSFGLAMLFACETNLQKMEQLTEESSEAVVSSYEIEWLYTKNGVATFRVEAPEMFNFEGENPYVEFPKGLQLYSYQKSDDENAFMKADYAIQYVNKRQVEASGNVLLKNEKGEKLETEFLIWDEEKERIYTEEFVKITKEGQVVMGEGFESDIYFSAYTLKKSRGIINLEHAE